MNAKIINADIEFDPDIAGSNGRLFYISLRFKIEDGGSVTGRFNFLQLPQILKKLEIDKFSQIVGQYVKVPDSQIGDKFIGFTHIFDSKMDLIKVDDRYFGDDFFNTYMNALNIQDF